MLMDVLGFADAGVSDTIHQKWKKEQKKKQMLQKTDWQNYYQKKCFYVKLKALINMGAY